MAKSRLSGRLARIRENRQATVSVPGKAVSTASPVQLPGWQQTNPYLYERVSKIRVTGLRPDFSDFLPLLFPREKGEVEQLVKSRNAGSSLVFFDLETTGLSHGAGTVAFMAGIARFSGQEPKPRSTDARILEIHQLLLADYPGESAFLTRFSELVGDHPVLVSFNGKCFDSQILTTRFLMNGMKPECIGQQNLHLDLVFPSRRIWKQRLGSCRLSILEEQILGTPRVDDLPGSEAPEAWFSFLRNGETGRLLAIGDHNRDDCASLARLLYALDLAIEQGSDRAALIRALDLRTRKDYEGAAVFLKAPAFDDDPVALRLLAIDAEHRIGDWELALTLAAKLGDEKRERRLAEKISRRKP